MKKYYLPTLEEFTLDLECEVYDQEFNNWASHTVSPNSISAFLPLLEAKDIRVKYLDSEDFNILGYIIKKPLLKTQKVILDILLDGTEVMGEEDIHDEENLNILHNTINTGIFRPYKPKDNVEINGKKYSIKNITELRKILK